jgi:hypothetical protein
MIFMAIATAEVKYNTELLESAESIFADGKERNILDIKYELIKRNPNIDLNTIVVFVGTGIHDGTLEIHPNSDFGNSKYILRKKGEEQ